MNPADQSKELTYEDVFLMPQLSEIRSRMNVDITPEGNMGTTLPVVIANMNAVAGKRMAESVTRRGGTVVLPQDMGDERLANTVNYIKNCHHIFETPIVLSPDDTIQKALSLIGKRSHGAVIITDQSNKPVGIFTEKDAESRDRFTPLSQVMRTDLITINEELDPQEIFGVLHKHRLSLAPVVDKNQQLVGVVTKKGAVRSSIYNPALNKKNQLLTSVAVGINKDLDQVVDFLKNIDVDIFVLDTAHGHQKRMINSIEKVRKIIGPDKTLVAGNVVSPKAVQDFVTAGASIVKVGVGPGAMCTTRMMTGMGRPQFSAVYHCSKVAKKLGANVWADGGVRHPRDVAIALAAGASHAMIGSWVSGTHESVGDLKYDEKGRAFKQNFGMASKRAVTDRNDMAAAFARAQRQYFEEGISDSRMYLKKGEESVEDILDKIAAGLRSSCAYTGVDNLKDYYDNVVVGVQTSAGYKEGKPLHQSW